MIDYDDLLRILRDDSSTKRTGYLLARSISRWLGFPVITIESYNSRNAKLRLVGVYGGRYGYRREAAATETLSGVAALSGRPFYKRFSLESGIPKNDPLIQGGIRTLVCIPVLCGNETIGVLSLFHFEEKRIDQSFRKSAEALARRLGKSLYRTGFLRGKTFRSGDYERN
jgi:hypothetical protein